MPERRLPEVQDFHNTYEAAKAEAERVALAAAGYDAVLVGEHLVTSGDPAAAIAALRVPRDSAGRVPRSSTAHR